MKKLYTILLLICFLIFTTQNVQASRPIVITGLDSSNSGLIRTFCITGYVFVKISKSPMLTQYFEISKSGRSIPLTCKKYIENKNKILKANTVLVDLKK